MHHSLRLLASCPSSSPPITCKLPIAWLRFDNAPSFAGPPCAWGESPCALCAGTRPQAHQLRAKPWHVAARSACLLHLLESEMQVLVERRAGAGYAASQPPLPWSNLFGTEPLKGSRELAEAKYHSGFDFR